LSVLRDIEAEASTYNSFLSSGPRIDKVPRWRRRLWRARFLPWDRFSK